MSQTVATSNSHEKNSLQPVSNQATAAVKAHEVKPLLKQGDTSAQELYGTGFTYRHDWGNRHGEWKLTLNWGAINCNSRVFVSASEFSGGDQCDFVGGAKYTVHNVAPNNGAVTVWVEINWDSDIRLHLDYLVINP